MIHPLTHSLTHSPTQSVTCSPTTYLTNSLTQALTHESLLIRPPTHSTQMRVYTQVILCTSFTAHKTQTITRDRERKELD